MPIESIRQHLSNELAAVDMLIGESVTTEVPLIKTVCEHIIQSGGKRLRPLIALLTAKAAGECSQNHYQLAAIVEFLHTATLLHDDVVDESKQRRGRETANALWGNRPSILVGDFLLSRTLQMMVSIENLCVIKILANATNTITTGEMLQLTNVRNPKLDEDTYFAIIRAKTAVLFAASCEAAATLSGLDAMVCESLRQFGDALGMAFQLADDALDYAGDSEALGKSVGDDLAEGKVTYPLIKTLQLANNDEKKILNDAIIKGHGENLPSILALLTKHQAIEATYTLAQDYSRQAIQHLACLAPSNYKEALTELATYAVARRT